MTSAERHNAGANTRLQDASDAGARRHDLCVLYSCSFALSRPGGKSAGTRRKLSAVRHLCRTVTVVAPEKADTAWAKALAIVTTEIRALATLLWQRKRIDVYISRAFSGVLAILLARVLGVTTAREIHADSFEEAAILAPTNSWKRGLLRFTASVTHRLDQFADIRFFNHPALLSWFAESDRTGPYDVAVYNGGQRPTATLSPSERQRLRRALALPTNQHLLVFTGSASPWHGIERLVELQKCFNRYADPVQIVCAGGSIKHLDPTGLILNIAPASGAQCERYIEVADFCLLPLEPNRRSPGSPIKLFDYLMHRKYVITQEDVQGYSDVAESFGAGILVDFRDTEGTRARILEAIPACGGRQADISDAVLRTITWEARMEAWLQAVERSKAGAE